MEMKDSIPVQLFCSVDDCDNTIMEYFDKCEDHLIEESNRLECEEKHWSEEYWA